MTVQRLEAMISYWEDHPPLVYAGNEIRMILRGYFGIKDKPKIKKQQTQELAEDEFRKQFQELAGFMGSA